MHRPALPARKYWLCFLIALLALAPLAAQLAAVSPALAASPGAVVAWGWNPYGQTNVPAGLTDVTAVAAGSLHSLALKRDGTVVAWGDNSYGQTPVPADLWAFLRAAMELDAEPPPAAPAQTSGDDS